jgi:peptidyl-prolyl cis-trans isomerase SurA
MKKNVLSFITLTLALLCSTITNAKEVPLDKIVAIVDSGVVLESEVNALVDNVKRQAEKNNQPLPSERALRTQALEKLINDSILLQLGERMGIKISDAQLDQTLTKMAQENGLTLEQFRQAIIADGNDYERYRESIRNEIITNEVRRAAVRNRIFISQQEVNNLIDMMKAQTNNNVEYHLGHILIEFPPEPTQDDINKAKERAEKVIELLKSGSDFAKIAIASSGASNALEGGDMGWMTINEMPTLFSEVVDGKSKGDIFGPIRTGLGFSIVKILDIRGRQKVEQEEVRASHILIKPSIILSEEKAKEKLAKILEDIKAGKATFEEMAKEYSEGPTAVKGGDLGWADPQIYDPAFRDALATMKEGEYHEPFRSSFGWHIVKLTGRRMIDATNQMNENRAYQLLYNRKFGVESARWMKEKRDEAYIEILED